MTTNEVIAKNLNLAFGVVREVIADPELIPVVDEVASGGTIILFDKADAELSAVNDAIAAAMTKREERHVRVGMQRGLSLVPR